MHDQKKAYLYGLATVLLWSTVASAFKLALRYLDPAQLLLYARVGNMIFISPFLSLIFIHFLVGERILSSTFVGLVLVVAGLLIQQLKSA